MTHAEMLGVFAAAFVLAALATPLVRRVALRLGIVDRPTARKGHVRPTPLLGGIALYVALVGSLLVGPRHAAVTELAAIIVGATWMALVGLWDDRRGLSPAAKLIAEIAAATALLLAGVAVALPVPAWVNAGLTVAWVVGISNAFNLLDNMDGLAAGLAAVASASFLLLAALNGQVLVGALAAALLGACLGFLGHNFSPASIFMGDAGSLLLGFLVAVLGIKLRFPANVPTVTWMVPILVLGVAVLDTTLVVVSRLRRGVNPLTTPGRDHLSHRLVRLGRSEREAVLLLYLAGCVCAGLAVFVSMADVTEAYLVGSCAAAAGVAAIAWLERRTSAGPAGEPL